jgi:hypothetical protein
MSIRVDPRRLSFLKELAAAEGLRPGQLVQRWIEERLDAERSGEPMPVGRAAPPLVGVADQRMAVLEAHLTTLTSRVEQMVERVRALEGVGAAVAAPTPPAQATAAEGVALSTPRRRGRPPKARLVDEAPTPNAPAPVRRTRRRRTAATPGERIALHDEIIAVIRERGAMTAAQLAAAIKERGRYQAPRSARPLDAAIVNSRVSNPVYRSRFRREGGRIGLAE